MKEDLISLLKSDKDIYAECPDEGAFPLHKAAMFYVDKPIPAEIKKLIEQKEEELKKRENEIKKKKERLKEKSEIATRTTNLGKVLEKVAPALRGFDFDRRDCRALFEPIDYIVFNGLSSNEGRIDSLCFIDIKTGRSSLNAHQRQIKNAIEKGRLFFDTFGGKL